MTTRNIAAWAVGIVSFMALSGGSWLVLDGLEIVTYVDFGESRIVNHGLGRMSYEEETTGTSTGIGFATAILSAMFAVRIGMAVSVGRMSGNVSEKGAVDFKVWVWGIIAYGIGALLLDIIFGYADGLHQFARRIIELAFVVLLFVIGATWRNRRLAALGR